MFQSEGNLPNLTFHLLVIHLTLYQLGFLYMSEGLQPDLQTAETCARENSWAVSHHYTEKALFKCDAHTHSTHTEHVRRWTHMFGRLWVQLSLQWRNRKLDLLGTAGLHCDWLWSGQKQTRQTGERGAGREWPSPAQGSIITNWQTYGERKGAEQQPLYCSIFP